jgi:hypothetical protein
MKLIETNLTIKSFVITSFVASVMFVANSAQAASLTYDWSFSRLANDRIAGGTFVADSASGLLSSISGDVRGVAISNLLGVNSAILGNDNLVPLKHVANTGISFVDIKGTAWWVGWLGGEDWVGLVDLGTLGGDQGNFQYSVTSAVPEPLTILGAMTAVGFGAGFKRKLAKSQKERKD